MLAKVKTKLAKKTQLTHDVWIYNFSLFDSVLTFLPGQYLILPVKKTNGEIINRLYSIASPPSQKNSFDLLIQLIPNGMASTIFSGFKLNDEVIFQGPAGAFSVKDDKKDLIFLATGTGIAPMRSIFLSQIPADSRSFFLLWGIPKRENIYLFDELKELSAKYKNFDFKICLSRETNLSFIKEEDRGKFLIGRVCAGLDNLKLKQNPLNQNFYLCGGRDVVDSIKGNLLNRGISPDSIIFERF